VQQTLTISVLPKEAASEKAYKAIAAKHLGIDASRITFTRITKKSIDARQREIKINLSLHLVIDEKTFDQKNIHFEYPNVGNKQSVIVVGAGPAGLFASLRLIELGLKPILFERGKDVSERKKDLARISREHIVDPDSNYCFGEGGAGTYSDGKMYTRSNKRGNLQRIYEVFHFHGANENILYEAHPHIGTDMLPEIIKKMRATILQCGGEVHFQSRVDKLIIESGAVTGIQLQNGSTFKSKAVILATGHSARDTYRMLHTQNILLEAKQFAMGVRVEHPQQLIDKIQYHGTNRDEFLPAASYSLVEQINGRGVFSFCMCPGGFIVPSATAQNQVVVNGMSPSNRNSPYANSGIVTEILTTDLVKFQKHGVLAGLAYQENLENLAWEHGGRTQTAPAQRLTDFVSGKSSANLPKSSYFPGTTSSAMHEWLPEEITKNLQQAFKRFDSKMKGFLTHDAQILGVESRTSSPIRIPRDKLTFCHSAIFGLYPCGEGSGFAGGIASSAMDGENCADRVAQMILS
jgi:uncharacterized FAD-dependent dehydrogenase